MSKIVFAAAAALAATVAATASALAWERGPVQSDQNLRFARAYVERARDMLSHDQADYGGHRVAAMTDINEARADLTTALRYDHNKGDAVLPAVTLPGPVDAADRNWVRGQHRSNENIEFTRRYVEKAIDTLSHDREDYGGYRVKAIGELEQARQQLTLALQSR